MNLAGQLLSVVSEAFAVSEQAYDLELSQHEHALGLAGEYRFTRTIPPKFFTGDPEALRDGRYLLVLSLNHKFVRPPWPPLVASEIAALRGSPEQRFAVCSGYLHQRTIYSFFANFKPVVDGMGFDPNNLFDHVFFLDVLPFFSVRSAAHSERELSRLSGTLFELNRAAIEAVVTSVRPAAIHLNGRTAFSALGLWGQGSPSWSRRYLDHPTRAGACWLEHATVELCGQKLPAFRSNFLRTVYGPNSTEQRFELGQCIANPSLATARGPAAGRVVAEPRRSSHGTPGDQAEFLALVQDLLRDKTGQEPRPENTHGHSIALGDQLRLWVEAVTRRRGYPPAPDGLLLRVRIGSDDVLQRRRLARVYREMAASVPPGATLHAQDDGGHTQQRWIETFWIHDGDMDADLETADVLIDWWRSQLASH